MLKITSTGIPHLPEGRIIRSLGGCLGPSKILHSFSKMRSGGKAAHHLHTVDWRNHWIIESLGVEKTSKIVKSNLGPNLTMPTKPYHPLVFWTLQDPGLQAVLGWSEDVEESLAKAYSSCRDSYRDQKPNCPCQHTPSNKEQWASTHGGSCSPVSPLLLLYVYTKLSWLQLWWHLQVPWARALGCHRSMSNMDVQDWLSQAPLGSLTGAWDVPGAAISPQLGHSVGSLTQCPTIKWGFQWMWQEFWTQSLLDAAHTGFTVFEEEHTTQPGQLLRKPQPKQVLPHKHVIQRFVFLDSTQNQFCRKDQGPQIQRSSRSLDKAWR